MYKQVNVFVFTRCPKIPLFSVLLAFEIDAFLCEHPVDKEKVLFLLCVCNKN